MPVGYSNPFSNIYTDAYNNQQGLAGPPVQGYIRPDGRLTYGYQPTATTPGTPLPNVPSPNSPTPTVPTPTAPTPNDPAPLGYNRRGRPRRTMEQWQADMDERFPDGLGGIWEGIKDHFAPLQDTPLGQFASGIANILGVDPEEWLTNQPWWQNAPANNLMSLGMSNETNGLMSVNDTNTNPSQTVGATQSTATNPATTPILNPNARPGLIGALMGPAGQHDPTGQGTSSGDQTSTDAPSAESTANPQSNMGHPTSHNDISDAHTQSVQNVVDNPQMAQAMGIALSVLSMLDPTDALSTAIGIGNKANEHQGLPTSKQMALNPQLAVAMAKDYLTNKALSAPSLSMTAVGKVDPNDPTMGNPANDRGIDTEGMSGMTEGPADGVAGVSNMSGQNSTSNTANQGTVDTSGMSSMSSAVAGVAADGGGGGAGGGDSVICTELHRQKLLSDEVYKADVEFAKNVPDVIVRGYHVWGIPTAKLMRKSKLATNIAKHAIRLWTDTVMSRPTLYNFAGLFLIPIGMLLCAVIGTFVPKQDTSKLYEVV